MTNEEIKMEVLEKEIQKLEEHIYSINKNKKIIIWFGVSLALLLGTYYTLANIYCVVAV